MDELLKRHGAHHNDNIKYGYIIFCVSVLYAVTLAIANYMFFKRWTSSGEIPHRSIWAKIRSTEKWMLNLLLWIIIVLILAFWKVHNPIEHFLVIVKRLGRLAFCLVPIDVLLVIRPSLITNSYLELITLHKWFLRLIIAMSALHGFGFLVKWIIEGTFWSKTTSLYNFLGVGLLALALGLVIISLQPIRKRFYAIFYLWHNVVVFLFIVPMFWHARPGVSDFILLISFMLAFQIIQKISSVYKIGTISIIDDTSSSLQVLRIQKPSNYPVTWCAGAHIRLSNPMTDIKFWVFPSHPYTIASLLEDRTMDLVVRKGLRFQVSPSINYSVSKPTDSLSYQFYETAQEVVILCGGSGISLGASVFRELLIRSSFNVRLVWCITCEEDVFVLKQLGISNQAEIYVTRSRNVDEQEDSLLQNDLLLELQTLNPISADSSAKENSKHKKEKFNFGRPNLDEIFSHLVSSGPNFNNWIVACGPQTMIKEAKLWGHNKVLVFSEYYGF